MSRIRSTFLMMMFASALQLSHADRLQAEPVTIHADYSVRLVGLPVAYAGFVSEVDGSAYTITGSLRTSVLSDIIAKTRGNVSVSGKRVGDRLLASDFQVNYTSGKDTQKIEIEFRDGNVKSATNTPKRKKTGNDWVPLSAEDMRAVLDPLSGMVFPGDSNACPRSLPIFDGQSRVTLHLKPLGVRPYSTKGFAGDAIACSIRFEPKAGYRKSSSGIKYLTQLKSMEVWFAKHERGNLYAPVYVKVPTTIGQVVVAATRFGS